MKGEAAGAAVCRVPLLHNIVPVEQIILDQCNPNCFGCCLCRCAHSPRLWGTGTVMEKCSLGYIMASWFFGKVVWCWCMNEVEKPKVLFFR